MTSIRLSVIRLPLFLLLLSTLIGKFANGEEEIPISSTTAATDEPTTTFESRIINTDELIADEDKGREFMLEFDRRMEELNYEIVEANFNFSTNITATNQARLVSDVVML